MNEKLPLLDLFATLHIFGYGRSQIISKDIMGHIDNGSLNNLSALIENINSLRGNNTQISMDNLFSVTIINEQLVQIATNSKEDKLERLKWHQLKPELIYNLVNEIRSELAKQPPSETPLPTFDRSNIQENIPRIPGRINLPRKNKS